MHIVLVAKYTVSSVDVVFLQYWKDIALLVIPSEQERNLGACVVLRWAVTLGGIVVPLAIKVLSCSGLVAELFRAQTAKANTNISFPQGIRRVWESTFLMCLPPSHTHTHQYYMFCDQEQLTQKWLQDYRSSSSSSTEPLSHDLSPSCPELVTELSVCLRKCLLAVKVFKILIMNIC